MYTEFVQNRLRQERIHAGYSQKKLAELTGLDDSLIGKIEIGLRKPDIETVGTLAEFFGVSVDWLFGLGQRHPKEPPKT